MRETSPPRTIEVPKEQLQAMVAARFPLHRRIGDLFELSVALPLLHLQPERDRIAIDFAITAAAGSSSLAAAGSLRISHSLRYEPGDRTVRAAGVLDRAELRAVVHQEGPGGIER